MKVVWEEWGEDGNKIDRSMGKEKEGVCMEQPVRERGKCQMFHHVCIPDN